MPDKKPRLSLAPLLVVLFTLVSGCVSLYKPEVQQGNVISAEMLETLKIGMTKRQVVFLLGTPLIADPFHPERWDYFYSLSKDGGKPEQHHLPHRMAPPFMPHGVPRVMGSLLHQTKSGQP